LTCIGYWVYIWELKFKDMEKKIKELRTQIDGLAQLTSSLEQEITMIDLNTIPRNQTIEEYLLNVKNGLVITETTQKILIPSKEILETVKSLYLAKAWLGKVLGELGAENPYKSGYKTVEDIEPTADVFKVEKINYITLEEYLKLSDKEQEDYYYYGITYTESLPLNADGKYEFNLQDNKIYSDSPDLRFFTKQLLTQDNLKQITQGNEKYKEWDMGYYSTEFRTPTKEVTFLEFPLSFNGDGIPKKLNHIEKVDYLRTEIQALIQALIDIQSIRISTTSEYSLEYNSILEKLSWEYSLKYLSESRFWLGFELQRIKENEKS
jgi:hypothetical protein